MRRRATEHRRANPRSTAPLRTSLDEAVGNGCLGCATTPKLAPSAGRFLVTVQRADASEAPPPAPRLTADSFGWRQPLSDTSAQFACDSGKSDIQCTLIDDATMGTTMTTRTDGRSWR